jgi:hypothetical protein
MSEQEPLFEIISADEFRKESITRQRREVVTEPRNQTTWFALPTEPGWCTVRTHKEIQSMLSPEKRQTRSQYPIRHVFEINPGLFICRDCFLAGAGRDSFASAEGSS